MTDITVRDGRKALGLSQRALAERIGFDTGTVSRWERGVLEPPRLVLEFLAARVRIMELEAAGAPKRRRKLKKDAPHDH